VISYTTELNYKKKVLKFRLHAGRSLEDEHSSSGRDYLYQDDEFRDEFGFVLLSDGTVAPFYVSLPGILASLHERFPEPEQSPVPGVVYLINDCCIVSGLTI